MPAIKLFFYYETERAASAITAVRALIRRKSTEQPQKRINTPKGI